MLHSKETNPFYQSRAWKQIRELALMRDGGFCQDCLDAIRNGSLRTPRRATLVHHIIPITEAPDKALDIDNLRSLCTVCHAQEHPEKGKKESNPAKIGEYTPDRVRVIKI